MNNDVTIRSIESYDSGPCSRLIGRAIENGFPGHYADAQIDEAREYFTPKKLLADMQNRYVAELDSVPIGTIGLVKYRGLEATGLILMLFVDPLHQRKGIGTRLVHYVEALARKKGFQDIRVNASFNALDFYTALGFKPLGDDEKIHDLGKPMTKSVPPGDK